MKRLASRGLKKPTQKVGAFHFRASVSIAFPLIVTRIRSKGRLILPKNPGNLGIAGFWP
ncbi:hypothetical protein ACFYXV_29085 [Streptomyces sp. NPDC002181]|uniref:hypothetical protein n=1 Tax=unclassified Streptomyces TaxID=2593676 RepID=UPI00365BF1F7